ncbi:MAG TPA: peptidylprolyl isomerase, partial [Lachnospiraceae bacterium]|nr:peptidylprolyl isomerase [Lachnospiraceae bacterium]
GVGHEALAGVLARGGVDVVICGGLGAGMQAALADAGIRVVSGATGNADRAVQAFLGGSMESQGVNC